MIMKVRIIVPGDLATVLLLMKKFAAFERLDGSFEATADRLHTVMFGESRFVDGIVAEVDGQIAGYALFYPYFASFRGQAGLYLEDLFVDEEYRGRRIGEAMLREIAKFAAERRFERIDFGVLEWNRKAVGFYERLGAVADPDERHFKFTDEAFRKLARP